MFWSSWRVNPNHTTSLWQTQIWFRCQDWWCHTCTNKKAYFSHKFVESFLGKAKQAFKLVWKRLERAEKDNGEQLWGLIMVRGWSRGEGSHIKVRACLDWISCRHQRKEHLGFLVLHRWAEGKRELWALKAVDSHVQIGMRLLCPVTTLLL